MSESSGRKPVAAVGCCLGAGSQQFGWNSAPLQVTDVAASLAPGGAPEKEARLHACLECGCSFTSAGLLLQHSKAAHGRERIHICPVCRKAFKRATHLKVQPRRESTEVPVPHLGWGGVCAPAGRGSPASALPPAGKGGSAVDAHTVEEHARRAGTGTWLRGHPAGAQPRARVSGLCDTQAGAPPLCSVTGASGPAGAKVRAGPRPPFSGPARSLWWHTSFCSPGLQLATLPTSVPTMLSEMENPSIN